MLSDYYLQPVLEFTLVLGCKVNCVYCPQKTLLLNKNKLDAKRYMTFEDFKVIIDKLPKNIEIHFSGFSEPFLHPECSKFIEYAFENGFKIHLYTTLVGFSENDMFIFKRKYIEKTVLHLPSIENYMNIELNEEYVSLVKNVNSFLTKKDRVKIIGSAINEKFIDIAQKAIIINHTTSRASNLLEIENKTDLKQAKKIICRHNRFIKNVVMPDGSVALCCMDWSLKHILGNLLKQNYEDIKNSTVLKNIKHALGDKSSNILCWNCEYAKIVY